MRKKTNPTSPQDSFRISSSSHRDIDPLHFMRSARYPESEQILTSHRSVRLVPNLQIQRETLIKENSDLPQRIYIQEAAQANEDINQSQSRISVSSRNHSSTTHLSDGFLNRESQNPPKASLFSEKYQAHLSKTERILSPSHQYHQVYQMEDSSQLDLSRDMGYQTSHRYNAKAKDSKQLRRNLLMPRKSSSEIQDAQSITYPKKKKSDLDEGRVGTEQSHNSRSDEKLIRNSEQGSEVGVASSGRNSNPLDRNEIRTDAFKFQEGVASRRGLGHISEDYEQSRKEEDQIEIQILETPKQGETYANGETISLSISGVGQKYAWKSAVQIRRNDEGFQQSKESIEAPLLNLTEVNSNAPQMPAQDGVDLRRLTTMQSKLRAFTPAKAPMLPPSRKTVKIESALNKRRITAKRALRDIIRLRRKSTRIIDEFSIMTKEQRFQQAARYFLDAKHLRPNKHEFDTKCGNQLYNFHSHPFIQSLRHILMWLLLFLMFWEPSHSQDYGNMYFKPTMIIECVVLSLFVLDDIIDTFHRCLDRVEIQTPYHRQPLFIMKLTMDGLLWLDFAIYMSLFPAQIQYFRWGRLIRVLKLAIVSKSTWHTAKAVLQALAYILDVTLLITVTIIIYALIGREVLAQAQADPNYNADIEADFSSLQDTVATLFTLTTLSNYPGVMMPYIKLSFWYLLYFVPFVAFAVTLFLPIPIAVVYQAFRQRRADQLLLDQVHERQCLFAAFCCLDIERAGFVSLRNFQGFFSFLYNGKHSRRHVVRLFRYCDPNQTGFLVRLHYYQTLKQFFKACELSLYMSSLRKRCAVECKCCTKIRLCCNKAFKLNKIV